MGEGTPKQERLRSSLSDSTESTPAGTTSEQIFLPPPPSAIHPITSLELRVRWLEALVSGVNTIDGRYPSAEKGAKEASQNAHRIGLLKQANEVQHQLDQIISDNAQLRRFVGNFDEYEHILNPSFALAPTNNPSGIPSYEELTDSELDALMKEMEPDLRAADRDLREIQALDKRGVAGAGKLGEHEPLRPRLEALIKATRQDNLMYRALEERLADFLQRYTTHVSALSELFMHWNDSVTEAEDFMTRLEKEVRQKARTSFD